MILKIIKLPWDKGEKIEKKCNKTIKKCKKKFFFDNSDSSF